MPDPQDEKTFLRSKMNWELQNGGKHKVIRAFYQELIAMRARIPALSELSKTNQEVVAFAEQSTLFVRRWSGDSHVFIVFHFGETTAEIEARVPAGRWKRMLGSVKPVSPSSDAGDSDYLSSTGMTQLSLGPWEFCLFIKATE